MAGACIVLLCVVAAIIYGVAHAVTARVCVEYFTIGHAPVLETHSPTLLALFWGTVATWWVGLMLGIVLSIAARGGRAPRRSAREIVIPVMRLLGVVGVCAIAAGVIGWLAGRAGALPLPPRFAFRIPPERHAAFVADGAAHLAAYLVGALGGVVLSVRVWRARRREAAAAEVDERS
jgi:hypothetical protein